MLCAKIKWSDFPLTYNCGSEKEASESTGIPISADGTLAVVIGYGWVPSEDDIEQVLRYHANDVYSPHAKNPEAFWDVDTFSVETEKLVWMKEVSRLEDFR